jgi:ferric-dicitrate binding protein FerR (iron transport regulator)
MSAQIAELANRCERYEADLLAIRKELLSTERVNGEFKLKDEQMQYMRRLIRASIPHRLPPPPAIADVAP